MSTESGGRLPETGNGQSGTVAQYLDKVKELIPAEVSAAFLAINSAVPLNGQKDDWVRYFFYGLIGLCGLYMWFRRTSIIQLLFVTFIAFPVWAANISLARVEFLTTNTWLPACALFFVTAAAPLVTLAGRR